MKQLPDHFQNDEVLKLGWTDVHTHLNFLETSPKEALDEALSLGVKRVITIGTEPNDLPIVLKLAEDHAPHVFCTLGIHPHEGKLYNSEIAEYLRSHLSHPRVVAVGEIGLDYFYGHSSKEEQIFAFREQMKLAEQFQLPVEVHTRDAEDDTIKIFQEFKGRVRGIVHCFTGTQRLADVALDCGYNISFSGIVTFKNAEELRQVCRNTPIDRMHVETDAPFLSPVPVRGQKNRPSHVLWVAERVAELKNTPIRDFCQQMKVNAESMFPKLIGPPPS